MGMTTVTVAVPHALRFTCATCRASAEVTVLGRASASASTGPYGVDIGGGREEATTLATHSAERDARIGLGLARCPRCGRGAPFARGFGWLRRWRTGVFVSCVVLCASAVGLGVLQSAGIEFGKEGAGTVIGPVVGFLAVLVPVLWMVGAHRRRVAEVDAAVRSAFDH